MKLLHTSDWHVGKAMRGRSRADEHKQVLDEMVAVVAERAVDLVLVAGDLFESAAPSPDAESLVYSTLLAFAEAGADVAVVSGNHDNARRLKALVPLFKPSRVHLVTEPTHPDQGGVQEIECRSGEVARVAFLPFVSQRGIVRSEHLMDDGAFQHAQVYAERVGTVIDVLASGFKADMPNIVLAHAFVRGGQAGGGERMAHLAEEYALASQKLPVTASYVALGHLHRPQKVSAAASTHYCGSPLQLDFGEQDQRKQVNLVEVAPGAPADVTPIALQGGRQLRTISGPPDQLPQLAEATGDAWLRVEVDAEATAGLADSIRSELGERVVEVRLKSVERKRQQRESRQGRPPQQLFDEFLQHRSAVDRRVSAAFGELLDEASSGEIDA